MFVRLKWTASLALLASVALNSGCNTRATANAYDTKDATEKGSTQLYCKISNQRNNGSQVQGLVGRSKANAIEAVTISVPSKENNDLSTVGFISSSKEISELKIDRMGMDLYDRWGRLARISGGIFNKDNTPVMKIVVWFNTTVPDGKTGRVEFEEGKAEDPVKVVADMDCR